MSHDFTPRRVGEILDDAIGLVRANFRTIGVITAVVVLPIAAAYSVVASFYLRSIFDTFEQVLSNAALETSGPAPDTTIVVIAMLLQGLGLLYAASRAMLESTVYANSARLLERRSVPLKEALRGGLRSIVNLIVVQIATNLIASAAAVGIVFVIAFGAVALTLVNPAVGLAGIFLAYLAAFVTWGVTAVLFALAGPVAVIEGGIGRALSRSVSLVRRHFWRVLLVFVASGLLVAQFESAIAAPTIVREIVMGVQSQGAVLADLPWGWKVFDGLVQGVAIAVVLPVAACVSLLTYLDLRARDEGMDLVVRARELLPR